MCTRLCYCVSDSAPLSCVHTIFGVASNRVSVPVVDRDGSLNNMDAGPPQDLPINIQVNAQ